VTSDESKKRAPGSDQRIRRPYQKPAFKHEKVFETMALGCGKIGGTGGICNTVPKLS
jgi:hypothetical protein